MMVRQYLRASDGVALGDGAVSISSTEMEMPPPMTLVVACGGRICGGGFFLVERWGSFLLTVCGAGQVSSAVE